jgi:hypothetical protein
MITRYKHYASLANCNKFLMIILNKETDETAIEIPDECQLKG